MAEQKTGRRLSQKHCIGRNPIAAMDENRQIIFFTGSG
jgi:hypothetical protein